MAEQQQTQATEQQPKAESEGEDTSIQPAKQEGAAPVQRGHRGIARLAEASPFGMMRHFADEIDRVFSSMLGGRSPLSPMSPFELVASGGWLPAIESYVEDGNIVLCTDLPGMRPEDVKVEVTGDELVISGERVHEKQETKGGFYSERQYGCFERRVALPEGCDPEKIEASFEDGVLKVSVAAPEEKQKGRKSEVKSKGGQEKSKGGQEQSKEAGADKVH